MKSILSAIGLSGVLVVAAQQMSATHRIEFFAVVLAIIAAIYVGFAVADGRTRVLLIEVTGASVFAALALLGLWSDAWFLVPGLGGHAVWDWVHHSGRHGASVRHWYIPFCVYVDVLLAMYVSVMLLAR